MIPILVGLAVFALVLVLSAPAFRGGSVLGVVVILVAVVASVGTAAAVRQLRAGTETRPSPQRASAVASWGHEHPLLRVAVGSAGGLVGLFVGLFAWWFAVALLTGCSFHCDVDDRNPLVGVVFSAVTVGVLAASARSVAWGAGGSVRVCRIAAAAGGTLGGLAVVAATLGSFFDA